MTPIRKSLVIPSHVPPVFELLSLPERIHASSLCSALEESLVLPKLCHPAGVAGLSRFSSLFEAKILDVRIVVGSDQDVQPVPWLIDGVEDNAHDKLDKLGGDVE